MLLLRRPGARPGHPGGRADLGPLAGPDTRRVRSGAELQPVLCTRRAPERLRGRDQEPDQLSGVWINQVLPGAIRRSAEQYLAPRSEGLASAIPAVRGWRGSAGGGAERRTTGGARRCTRPWRGVSGFVTMANVAGSGHEGRVARGARSTGGTPGWELPGGRRAGQREAHCPVGGGRRTDGGTLD